MGRREYQSHVLVGTYFRAFEALKKVVRNWGYLSWYPLSLNNGLVLTSFTALQLVLYKSLLKIDYICYYACIDLNWSIHNIQTLKNHFYCKEPYIATLLRKLRKYRWNIDMTTHGTISPKNCPTKYLLKDTLLVIARFQSSIASDMKSLYPMTSWMYSSIRWRKIS